MNQVDTHPQAQIVIVGLGKTGLSCARFLANQGADVMVVDSRTNPPGEQQLRDEFPQLMTAFGEFNPATLNYADTLVVSPGVSLTEPALMEAIEHGVEVIGDIELFARYADKPIIAITGSNGKSTVTTLVGEMATAAGKHVGVGGNIGTPALDLLADTAIDLYVLELSSFQLETTHSLKAAASVVLNVSQDHLDRYEGMDHYANAKRVVYQGSAQAIINRDDPRVAAWGREMENAPSFGLDAPTNDVDYGVRDGFLVRGNEPLLAVSDLKVAGWHNVANTLAALALGETVGLNRDAMISAAKSFAGLAHRCQWLAEQDGVNWFNDSKATNVGAAVAAINGMPDRVVLLAGGEGKGQDFAPLHDALAEKGRAAVLFGRDAQLLKAAIGSACEVELVETLRDAVVLAKHLAQCGDAVLLSPACASFDMFKGFEDRGDEFAAAVAEVLV